MDWWFHWLFALLLSPGTLDLGWFMLGNVVLDVFFILSFIQVAGFRPRGLSEMSKFNNKAGKTFFHKIGYLGHSLLATGVFLALSLLPSLTVKSLCYGLLLHQIIDLATHREQPNPIFYPFSMWRPKMGFVTWDLRNWNIIRPTLQLLSVLFLLKYLIFGFIF